MAALGVAMYGGFPSEYTSTITTEEDAQISQGVDEQYISTFFCRALYDYQTRDASSLSFHKNDIIEVLTQLESGWWDGLLGDERGWFPSNYVVVISDEEAELSLSGYDNSSTQPPIQPQTHTVQHTNGTNGVHPQTDVPQDQFASDSEWLSDDINDSGSPNGFLEMGNAAVDNPTLSNDFWMPQVTQDGQIYYVNTQTGQHSRDLPQEAEDTSDGDLAGLTTSQPSSRAGTSAGLGFGAVTENSLAGFGIPKRTGTPEPWVRKLADDGMSYYYWNKLTNQVSWTIPESEGLPKKGRSRAHTHSSTASSDFFDSADESAPQNTQHRLRAGTLPSNSRATRRQRVSVADPISDSDDSGLYSPDRSNSPTVLQSANGRNESFDRQKLPVDLSMERKPSIELTAAERIAQSLQQSLSPPPPDLVSDLSHLARDAIAAVILKNQQLTGVSRRSEQGQILDNLIRSVVVAVRNLLYISAPPSGHIPSNLIPRDARDRRETTASQTLLKPSQRKVTATLSKLVLSARAMEYDSGPAAHETPARIESDAEELERAILAFVVEVQRCQNEQLGGVGLKRIQGQFSSVHIGLGLVGAGAGGTWKGFGWVVLDDTEEAPRNILETDVFAEFGSLLQQTQTSFGALRSALRNAGGESQQRVWMASQDVLGELFNLLLYVVNIHIARHVDIDGYYSDPERVENGAQYIQTVDKAKLLIRTLESVVQSIYDDSSSLLLATQRIRRSSTGNRPWKEKEMHYEYLDAIATSLESNVRFLAQTLDALLSVGHDQADMAQGEYNSSIEWRMSRLSIIDNHFDARPMSMLNPADPESEDIVDFELAFGASGLKKSGTILGSTERSPYRSQSQMSDTTITLTDRTIHESPGSSANGDGITPIHALIPPPSLDKLKDSATMSDAASLFEDESSAAKAPTANASKIKQIFGDEAPEHIVSTKPWYLRPNYGKNDIIIDPDGSVRAGTVPALIERLTSHETGDPTFIKTFLMTYKSFTTLDELFDILVRRFFITSPDNLTAIELEEWKKLKQHIIQMRVLNTFRAMVHDEHFLEKEDMYILDRLKDFLLHETVSKIPAAKQLLVVVERARGGELKKMTINTTLTSPPTSIVPKTNKKLKLLDIDALELSRQLTIMESHLYQKIRPMECLQRSREQKTDHNDNIARVIQTSNRIANWVADSVLSHEDSRKRAAVIKQFISVADRCRSMHNYSTMVAIVSGLNSPPIRRLKRSWEQVNARHMSQLGNCEMTIDSGKNFGNYRSTLARVAPPCVPFIGVFLTTLTFIQDGSKDTLPGNLVNFRKRQKASEVIQDIQRWQTLPHHFHPLGSVQTYIEESLGRFGEPVDVGDLFWNLSLEREPREREDEKMARLLQESGFL
ncbi:ras guanine nucleotide exchange factor domain-containing protein [Hygrophoropsis aurantiaca]|uniref:Ras guanine nucleotide exchange factor domain-containing protein n=1 Tax=Hygrophoropsis aurantiaca TaxID=72124 RepID=A0ACB8ACT2_9AGAM|nr:ras guanine nucleotide exchange factor domain-containing protein [Hygrophoropsis aurantiaca]